ncbi:MULTISPECIES: branched-chain amino acid ABC transporter permease [unclassified Streptomyces]|uniref:branched-chain amino acid ABC transporter permease n=1 Tax=unclassified Streptomyces TaxID=2593676 RepID=UPI002E2CD1DE|nr:branched-chain amino acid ABC transporter permease [Streptomyces sp. NBC_00223]
MSGTDVTQRPLPLEEGKLASAFRFAPPVFRQHQFRTLAVVVVLGLVAPYVYGGDEYSDGIMNTVMIYSILTLGFFWCFSLGGSFTFATYGVYATGSYVSIWVANHAGGFWSGLIAATVVCALLGAVMKIVFARCSMIFFAIATMACGGLLIILFREWISFTGGFAGISDIAVPSFFGLDLNSQADRYYLMLGLLSLFLLLTVWFLRSPAYRDLQLARDNGPVAAVVGLKPKLLQLAAFTVGSGMMGTAGSLYAHNSGYVGLEAFDVDIALLVLLMLLLGGSRSIYGAVIGAAVLTYLPEYLRSMQKYSDFIYSLAVLLIVVAFPKGIAGLRETIQRRWKARA